ncbi:MAG TPA: nucleoside-diphosphate sugar epimerase/dehydratase [Bellilinea sp.]|nr:nucleoside-diphosphate sugar epimerase/dehydratase [Bellilinea sp.]
MQKRNNVRNRYILAADLILIPVIIFASFLLRFEFGPNFSQYTEFALYLIFFALIIKPIVYYYFGLYRRMWLYASSQELRLIVAAVTVASAALALIIALARVAGLTNEVYIKSIFVIDWFLSLIAVGGVRFLIRVLAESRVGTSLGRSADGVKRVLVIGAGDGGALAVREMQRSHNHRMQPVGFLDDDPNKFNQQIHGVPVIGTLQELDKVLSEKPVDEIIMAIPSAAGSVIRSVADVAHNRGIPFRTMPGLSEIIDGKVSVSRLREVEISDLLRREPARIHDQLIGPLLKDKKVLVTGAGGSIGRELCRQIARWEPQELIMLGHGENSIFEAILELHDSFPLVKMSPVIADVRDRTRLDWVMKKYRPEVIYHTAAHKHVSLMEVNIEEAVINNVLGTKNLVESANEHGIDRLVMISTDKAIHPTSIMGATKRMAELLVLNAAEKFHRNYTIVRFGNVLGSRGSVVPIFKQQIAQGGPLTITDPEMQRYFMTIPEAVYLVLQASTMGASGDTFMLNMGNQVKIVDLAEDLIRLSGLEPGKDIDIVFTGAKPGEKLCEDLWEEGNALTATDHPDIFRLEKNEYDVPDDIVEAAIKLIDLAWKGDSFQIVEFLDDYLPGSKIKSTPPPDLTAIQ